MKKIFATHKAAIIGSAAIVLIGGITMSFQDTPFMQQKLGVQAPVFEDTTKHKKNATISMKQLDSLLHNIDGVILQTGEQLKKIDLSKMMEQVQQSLKAVNLDEIMNSVQTAIQAVDINKIMSEVKNSLNEVDWSKTNADIQKAMEEAKQSIAQAKEEMKKVDMEEVKREIEKAKQEIKAIDLNEIKAELDKATAEIKKIDIDKIMAEAKQGIAEAKTELKKLKQMVTDMRADGLISNNSSVTISIKNGKLYIDGKEQSKATTNKYKNYFKTNNDFSITIEPDMEQ
jgi:hypothetical protein